MSNAVATTKSRDLVSFMEKKKPDFAAVSLVDPDKFFRVFKNALIKDPKIAEASPQSVYLECQKAVADGLVLDGREAALTRFNTKDGVQVAYIPMVAGIMKRVRNTGEVAAWSAELVYEEEDKTERFRYRAGADPHIHHEPIIIGKRGPVVAAYSAVKLRDGSYSYEVMTVEQMDRIRKRSKAQNGPWATDTEEMYRKTVIRRHAKRLPVSSDALTVTQRVDSLYDFDADTVEEEAPRPKKMSAAEKLKQAAASTVIEPDEYVTADGEIVDAEVEEAPVFDPGDEF